jgi:hypothetical protein
MEAPATFTGALLDRKHRHHYIHGAINRAGPRVAKSMFSAGMASAA